MRTRLVILLAALLLPSLLAARGPNTRSDVALDGEVLATITDKNILDKPTFWSGPMWTPDGPETTATGPADLADWRASAVPPPAKSRIYDGVRLATAATCR